MRKTTLDSLFPKTRQTVLSTVLLHPDRWWSLSELASHLKLTASSLQRELASLTNGEIIECKKEKNRVYYRANKSCLIIEELQSIMTKTLGVADQIRKELSPFLKKSYIAFIYGSLARGEEISTSDVDLMLIGDVKLSEMATSIRKVEKKIDREINCTIYSKKEYSAKKRDHDSFIETVEKNKVIFLKGNQNELKALA